MNRKGYIERISKRIEFAKLHYDAYVSKHPNCEKECGRFAKAYTLDFSGSRQLIIVQHDGEKFIGIRNDFTWDRFISETVEDLIRQML